MADNTVLNVGTAGDTYRSKDHAGVKTQVIAIDLNPAGSETLMAGAMPVSGTFWPATQPVSLAAAIAATQSGTWSVRSLDGAGNALTSAARGSERALSVQVVDASGTQVTNFGGGSGGGDTSLLALEAGGHLASVDGKLPAMGQALAAASVPIVLTAAQLTTLTPLTTVGVTGTFWQATQPVSGTVTANAGTGTFAVSAASLPLPSGASTAAKQPALGTAGTAASDVVTIQGIASMTAVKVDGSAVTQPVSGTFWQATQPISGTVTVNAGTNLNTSLLALESGGNLATIAGRTPALGQALAAASVPVVLTAAQMTTLTPLTSVAVTGTFWQATQPVSLASNVTVVGTGTFAVQAAQSGTWNVGTVTTVTTVASVTAIANALPAGTNLIGQTSASHETGTLYNGTTALTPKFAIITASSSGATTVVAAVTSKKIRVLRWRVSANGTVNVKWQSHVIPTDKSGLSYCTQFKDAGGGYCPLGHFETIAGEALDINLSAAVAVSGELTYAEV